MRIQLFSDLHMDRRRWQPEDCGADVFVVAGDLFDDGCESVRWCGDLTQSTGKPVVYTPGNHCLMGARVGAKLAEMHRLARRLGVHLLHNQTIVIDGVRFYGTPLWTDFRAAGDGMKAIAMHAARDMMADFSAIFTGDGRGKGSLLTPAYSVKMHERALRGLLRGLADAYTERVVILTHHAPSVKSQSERFRGSAISPAFVSNLDEFVGYSNAALWVHGHVHESANYVLGSTRVVCNPKGSDRSPNPNFDPALVVEV